MRKGRATILIAAVAICLVAAADSCSSTGTGPGGSSPAAKVNKLDANLNGYELKVTEVVRNAPANEFSKPDAGNHFVKVTVSFINNSSDKQHPDTFCCKLKDSTGITHTSDYSATGCDLWEGVDIAKGAALGPRPVCFQAAGDPNAPLFLIWSPSFGSSDVEIALQ